MAAGTDYIRNVFTVLVYMSSLLISPVWPADDVCVRKGRIYTELPWYGYLLHKTFQEKISHIEYQISYPVSECCANLLYYYDDQMRTLKPEMTCEEREEILPATNNQLIPLNDKNGTVGCRVWHEDGSEPMYECVGERTFMSNSPRSWYIAISRCGATTPIAMNYLFNISGYYGDCEDSQDPYVIQDDPVVAVLAEDGRHGRSSSQFPPLHITTKRNEAEEDTHSNLNIAETFKGNIYLIASINLYCHFRKFNR